MRKSILSLIVILFVLAYNLTYAQNRIELQKAVDVSLQNEPVKYRVDARPFLEKLYKATGFDPSRQERVSTSLRKAAWNFTVGSQVSWNAGNFSTNQYYKVPSTCQRIGEHCYIFVEDAIWGSSVTEAGIDSVILAFDSKTPANPNKGIYQTNVEIFGPPPDVDGDPKIIILILDIIDGATGGGYISGYFSPVNEVDNINSNKAEFYYVDGVQNNLTTSRGVKEAMSTAAHEFQHMLHYNSLPSATTFFNECFSLTAEIICGYGLYNPSLYANESNRYLTSWRENTDVNIYTDYSRAARFGLYLLEQYGTAFFKRYLEKARDGINGVTGTIQELTGTTATMYTILPNWFMANYLNNKNIEPLNLWGYNSTDVVQMVPRSHNNPNVSYSGQIYNLAAEYITFTNGKNLSINFNNNNETAIKIKAVKYGSGQPVVEDVAANTDYSVPEFGTTYSKVTFVLYMVNPSPLASWGPYNYSYTATGTFEGGAQEIAYDNTEPVGVYVLSIGDTVAVRFDGIAGTKLDSIRVALRNTVQIEGGIWRAGISKFTGQRLAGPFMVAGITTPEYNQTTESYPIPYPNWVTVDLRSNSIDASSNFIAEFVINGEYENSSSPYNRVMHTSIPGTSAYHSHTYLNNPTSGLPGWYFISDGSNISLYLIRAYVSLVTDADEVIELLPTAYSLDQNYPNPFNPSTIISYQLPKAGNVQIKIFDALGREVRSLINEEKSAGKFNIAWDGRDNFGSRVSSGIYFYTISSGSFLETKKMVLMK